MRPQTCLAVLLMFALSSLGIAQTCYYPNGEATEALIPCRAGTAAASTCCKDSDVCLKNGLCFSPGTNSVVRRGCTDQSWNSSECPDICMSEEYRTGDIVLTPCGEYLTFCCGQDKDARACCDSGNNTVKLGTGEVIDRDPQSCTTTITAGTHDPGATTSPTGTDASQRTSTTGANDCGTLRTNCNSEKTAAIALGALLGCALVGMVPLSIFSYRRRHRRPIS